MPATRSIGRYLRDTSRQPSYRDTWQPYHYQKPSRAGRNSLYASDTEDRVTIPIDEQDVIPSSESRGTTPGEESSDTSPNSDSLGMISSPDSQVVKVRSALADAPPLSQPRRFRPYSALATAPPLSTGRGRRQLPFRYVNNRAHHADIEEYLDLIYDPDLRQKRLHPAYYRPEVRTDRERRRQDHYGIEVAEQFDLTSRRNLQMLRHMYENYDAVTCYSMGLIEVGMIVYAQKPYVLGPYAPFQGAGSGKLNHVKVHVKGRPSVVVGKLGEYIQVAEITSFNGKGLGRKPCSIWNQYVGLKAAGDRDFTSPSPHQPLEIGDQFCDLLPQSCVHLITDKITLQNQILFAGRITDSSLGLLRRLIRKAEKEMSCW